MMQLQKRITFLTAVTPLKLVIDDVEIWTNPKPNSPYFTRPLRLKFAKETAELTKDEARSLREEISNLHGLIVDEENLKGEIVFHCEVCMLDGKFVNSITETKSTQTCNVMCVESNQVKLTS